MDALSKTIKTKKDGYRELARAIIRRARKDEKGSKDYYCPYADYWTAWHFVHDKHNNLRETCEALLEA